MKWLLWFLLLATSISCQSDNKYSDQRLIMVEDQIIKRGIEDQRVLDVMKAVERHKFVPEKYTESAYKDGHCL